MRVLIRSCGDKRKNNTNKYRSLNHDRFTMSYPYLRPAEAVQYGLIVWFYMLRVLQVRHCIFMATIHNLKTKINKPVRTSGKKWIGHGQYTMLVFSGFIKVDIAVREQSAKFIIIPPARTYVSFYIISIHYMHTIII